MHFPLAGAPQEVVSATLRFYGDLFYPSVRVHHIDADVGNDVALWEIDASQTQVLRFFNPNVQPVARWFDADATASCVKASLPAGRFWGPVFIASCSHSALGHKCPPWRLWPVRDHRPFWLPSWRDRAQASRFLVPAEGGDSTSDLCRRFSMRGMRAVTSSNPAATCRQASTRNGPVGVQSP